MTEATNASSPEAKEPCKAADIADEVRRFVTQIQSMATILPDVMFAVQGAGRGAGERFEGYATKYGTLASEDDGVKTYSFKPPYDVRAAQLSERTRQAHVARHLMPPVIVLALVGQYDAFVGRLLRALFLLRPELIQGSERTLTFSQLVGLGTIEGAQEYLLEKEVESVLRKSHADQFTWMESKFGLKLTDDLESWPRFIELTERRNLFAHANGVVSDQYLANCAKHKVVLPDDCCRGTTLGVDPDYVKAAYRCIFEIGVKLAQVLWRKQVPEELQGADESLNNVTFDLIVSRQFELAIALLDFGCVTLKRHASEQQRRMLLVNRAQAYKWHGDGDMCNSIIGQDDWTACGPDFQLAIAVLRNDFVQAAKVMHSIGPDGDVNETGYQEWPLFQEFRRSEEFSKAYQAVFGEPFVHLEKTVREDQRERERQKLEELRVQLDESLADE